MTTGEDVIMMFARVAGRRPGGRTYDKDQAYLYRVRNGKLIEGHSIPIDQRAFNAFMSD